MLGKKFIVKRAGLILLLVFLLLIMCGCQKDTHLQDNVLIDIPTEAAATPTPLPTATPTPVIDMPKDRFDALTGKRSDDDLEPEVIEFNDEVLVLNPFYASDTDSVIITSKTQAYLFDTDEEGNLKTGVDAGSIAYEYGFADDVSPVALKMTDTVPEGYRLLRVVLKEGIKYANGSNVSADDVIYSMLTLAGSDYDGPSEFNKQDIYGLKSYHDQIPVDRYRIAEAALTAGINPDGSINPSANATTRELEDFWSYFDKGGIRFAQDIVDFVNDHYGQNAYVQPFLSPSLTYSKVAADESLKVAYAFAIWGYMKSYDNSTRIMTDVIGNEYDLNKTELTAEDLYKAIFEYYGYDLDGQTGINYECPYGDKRFEKYVEEAYFADSDAVSDIAGIRKDVYKYPDGAVRSCIYFLIGNDQEISDLNIFVVPRKVYEGHERENILTGAGEYTLESVDEEKGVVRLVANDHYMLGSPRKKYIDFTWK